MIDFNQLQLLFILKLNCLIFGSESLLIMTLTPLWHDFSGVWLLPCIWIENPCIPSWIFPALEQVAISLRSLVTYFLCVKKWYFKTTLCPLLLVCSSNFNVSSLDRTWRKIDIGIDIDKDIERQNYSYRRTYPTDTSN